MKTVRFTCGACGESVEVRYAEVCWCPACWRYYTTPAEANAPKRQHPRVEFDCPSCAATVVGREGEACACPNCRRAFAGPLGFHTLDSTEFEMAPARPTESDPAFAPSRLTVRYTCPACHTRFRGLRRRLLSCPGCGAILRSREPECDGVDAEAAREAVERQAEADAAAREAAAREAAAWAARKVASGAVWPPPASGATVPGGESRAAREGGHPVTRLLCRALSAGVALVGLAWAYYHATSDYSVREVRTREAERQMEKAHREIKSTGSRVAALEFVEACERYDDAQLTPDWVTWFKKFLWAASGLVGAGILVFVLLRISGDVDP